MITTEDEVNSIKADKSIIEEKILVSFDESEAINGEIAKEKEVLAVEEKKYLDKKKEELIGVASGVD